MKVRLLDPDRDLNFDPEGPWNAADLRQDLGLDTVFTAMADGDTYLREVAATVLLTPLTDVAVIRHRQDVLLDSLAHPDVVRRLYELGGEAIAREARILRGMLTSHPSYLLYHAVEVMEEFVDVWKQLRALADEHEHTFRSVGMTRLLAMLRDELDDSYITEVQRHIKQLKRHDRVLISAQLGRANKGRSHVLRTNGDRHDGLLAKITGHAEPGYSFVVPPRDDAGARALAALEDRGRDQVADALAQARDHVLDFFRRLRFEAGFFVACDNLHRLLAARGLPTCRPEAHPTGTRIYRASGLYDVGLALRHDGVVGNDVAADGKNLIVLTGANQGGKSTLLRSAGLAALMTQAGMFVGASWFGTEVATSIATHYKREEDASMRSGKFDEELARLSQVVDHTAPNGLVLSNESFSATNEQEGAQIGLDVLHALLDGGVRALFVTHLFELADRLRREERQDTLFLRARRHDDGRRDFRLVPGDPLPTSFGQDLFAEVMGRPA